jgi:SAM-dependent methyltransferase
MDDRQSSPAALRNRQPIAQVLKEYLPPQGTILEIASGTGEHALYLAEQFPNHPWLPTDINPAALASIAAWRCQQKPLANLYAPIFLDVESCPWPVELTPPPQPITAIVAINLIHISPWSASRALLAGADRLLSQGGILYLYGPYRRLGQELEPSNEAFDRSLQQRNPAWGLRVLEEVLQEARSCGLELREIVPMPANNLSVILGK